jgi:hypothetical protein
VPEARSRAGGRPWRVLVAGACSALVAIVLATLAVPALAQEAETTVPATDAGPTTVIPTTPAPTTAPTCVPAPAPDDIVFFGIMFERDGDTVRFDVRSVQQGPELPSVVSVSFPGEAQYFDEGDAYRVTASPSPEGGYTGRVRQPEGACLPLTVTARGEPLDTSLFGRLAGRWPSMLWAFFVPFAAVMVVLLLLVGLKRLVVWAFR